MFTRRFSLPLTLLLLLPGLWACGNGLEQLKAKAEAGDAKAQYTLGRKYLEGRGGAAREAATAAHWLKQAARQQHIEAAYLLGGLYAAGSGVPRNHAQAATWYQKAAWAGHPSAAWELGLLYENGNGVRRDAQEAYTWYSIAASGHSRKYTTAPQRVEARTSASTRIAKLSIDLDPKAVKAAKQEAARRLERIPTN